MFVRRTQTRTSASGETYFTHRLVRAERIGGKVRQVTLLNLGRHFELPPSDWPQYCSRLRELITGQAGLLATEVSQVVEQAAQHSAALLKPREFPVRAHTFAGDSGAGADPTPAVADRTQRDTDHAINHDADRTADHAASALDPPAPTWVDADSLALIDPRSVGVEALALNAVTELKLDEMLRAAGFNSVDRAAALGQIVARMAHPASERQTLKWLKQRSALGELIGYDYAQMSLNRLYRVCDKLIARHAPIEAALYARLSDVCGSHNTVALYDLTNTYFEGLAAANPLAQRGWSKEKRNDCPLLTLGLVLDADGFVRLSDVFAGNVGESRTLKGMLSALNAPPGAMVIVDRGLVCEDNLAWLREHGYRYLVMTRDRQAIPRDTTLTTASGEPVHYQRLIDADGDVRLHCHSPAREAKEAAMLERQRSRFEQAFDTLKRGLKRGRNRAQTVHQRIGRLLERHAGLAQHYQIQIATDPSGQTVTDLNAEYAPKPESRADLLGHYALRSNDTSLDGEALWRTYTTLTDVEAAFRSLKSELGLRPIHHQLDRRTKAHLWISVLAYQCVQYLRRQLKAHGIDARWQTLRTELSQHQRITATFNARDGGRLHVRKTTQSSAEVQAIYRALNINPNPGGIKRHLFRPEHDL